MALALGTRLGPYEILAAIGAGGMGEVYRARDTKLNRDVAIKCLPDLFADDPDRLARFQREAQVLASLNHPHIGAIYGLEDTAPSTGSGQAAIHALVMELVDGPTLADRIVQGPIPLDEALAIATQIAEALEAAHDQGITHRDLKPANIKVRDDGTVKVLDFGLAKLVVAEASGVGAMAALSQSPTLTTPAATLAGVILGTAAYMSPEQARGKAVDRRADIWAFGVVLFEMLTGERLFGGETISDTLASVLKTEPPWDALPPSTPANLRRVLRRCLDKDPKRRLQAIGDWRLLLEDVPQPGSAAQSKLTWTLPTAAAAILASALLALGFVHFRETVPLPSHATRFQVPLPEKTTASIFHLSPDGRTLAITATEGGRSRLWVRPLDSLDAQALAGTDGAAYPFWSPDSAFIGFFAEGKLKKIALAGGPPQTLCDAQDGRGGTWNSDGVVVFSPGLGLPLARVPAAGGVPAPVTKPANSEELHRYPEFLPDGHHFLYVITRGKPEANGLYVGSLDGTPSVRILADESSAVYVPPEASGKSGDLLFGRDTTLMAQPFDPGRLEMTGEMFPLAEHVGTSVSTNNGAFSASKNGVLAYAAGTFAQVRTLEWTDRAGKRLGAVGQPGASLGTALSPDEKRIVFWITKPDGGSDLWLHDLTRDVPSRFTLRPGRSTDGVWSPDGSRIAFQVDTVAMFQKQVNGTDSEQLLFRGGVPIFPLDWSRDGKFLVVQMQSRGQGAGYDLWLVPLEGDSKPVPYLRTPFNESNAQFSPDGRWMAYGSNESGQPQVYVQAIPATGAKWQISTTGGDQPRWRRNGTELFYISTDQKLMSVPVKTGIGFETGSPQPLFEVQPVSLPLSGRFDYQPTADGQRFLVSVPVAATPPITVVLNWQAGLKK